MNRSESAHLSSPEPSSTEAPRSSDSASSAATPSPRSASVSTESQTALDLQWLLGAESEDGFDTLWRQLAVDSDADADSKGRVRLSRVESGRGAPPSLPLEEGLEILPEVLGEGGMGVVNLARQRSLRREVAVKITRPGRPEAVFDMVREALITARLQHPNIIPVHRLCRGQSGKPLLVMQRIEGESWAELLQKDWYASIDASRFLPFLSDAALERHLRVLLQVCQAVAYAHSRGVIHRDLKPANVMLGPFGEVYLVDWGLALCRGSLAAELGLTRNAEGLIGTPQYMAPEMLLETEDAIDERSDVYQLGAILHEILTGVPPHRGGDLRNVLFSVFRSEPLQLPPKVPQALLEIVTRALARDPDERYASATELREALESFLIHKSSIQLSDEAQRRLEAVSVAMIRDKELSEREIFTRFSECRFAFLQALAIWPENPDAQAGLQAAVEILIRHELAVGAPDSAAMLLADLPAPAPELEAEVLGAAERSKQKLEKMLQDQRDADLEVGDAVRRGFALILALFWFLVPTTVAILHNLGELEVTSKLGYILYPLVHGTVQGAALWVWRKVLLLNRANRLMAVGSLVVFPPMAVLRGVIVALDLPIASATGLEIPLYTAVLFAVTVCLDQRLVWATLASMLAGIGAAFVPEQSYLWLGLGNGLTLFLVWLAWRDDAPVTEPASDPER